MRRLTCALIVLISAVTWAADRTVAAEGPRKIALIVAISEYLPSGGWGNLNSARDLEIVRMALERHRFEVVELTDVDATRSGIKEAIRRQLIEPASPGDVTLLHYSGHGQQITDAERIDEPDGWDEALVPYDAMLSPPNPYAGEKHLRDDELQDLLEELRRKVGPQGDVIVSLDSCFSGTGTRGTGIARGTNQPIGLRRPWEGEAGTEGGFVDGGGAARGVAKKDESDLSPLVALSAARNDELAWEARDANSRSVGSLSLAFSTALASADSETSYRALHARVKTLMAGYGVSNTPQIEGDGLDRALFGGRAIEQAPYLEVAQAISTSSKAEGSEADSLQVKGGLVLGVVPGSRIEIYPAGTVEPLAGEARQECDDVDTRPECPRAAGVVEIATMLTAEVKLDRPVELDEFNRGAWWAFVTERSFGALDISVRIETEGASGSWVSALIRSLEDDTSRLVSITEDQADVVIRQVGGEVLAENETDGFPLLDEPLAPGNPSLPQVILDRLESYARNQYLLRLEFEPSPTLSVSLEMLPCTLIDEALREPGSCTAESAGCVCDQRLPGSADGSLELSEGLGFEIEVTNSGLKDAYVSILDLMPNGDVYVLWPKRGEPAAVVPRDSTFKIPALWEVGPPFGTDVVKLFASKEPIDFQWLFGTPRGVTRGAPNALELLFRDTLTMGTRGSKSRRSVPADSGVNTFDLAYDIVPTDD